jgi:uncharacterized membrane protein YgcG
MRFRHLMTRFAMLALATSVALPSALFAQESPQASAQAPAQAPIFKKEELQQLLAPVALYPDQLLAQVLMASTYPLQIAQAAQWQKGNAKLSGEPLDKALNAKEWDPSVKSLVPFPQVLHMMGDKLEWTQKLGDAFLAQQADVMSTVQYLRTKAQEAGSLKSNKQQTVTKSANVIVIQPASPQVVYVPVYNPSVVYGVWSYPAYPPYYYPPPAGSAFVAGVFWGAAITASAHYWGWGTCNWHGGNVNIDVNRYNNINVNKNQITSNTWQHNPANRGQVPYRDQKSREQYSAKANPAGASREAKGYAPGSTGTRDLAKPGTVDGTKPGTRDLAKNGSRDLPKAGSANRPVTKDNAANRTPDAAKAKEVGRPAAAPSKASAPAAFDMKSGADVRAQADRGRSSVSSMDRQGGGRQSLGAGSGGGGRASGGGGGRRR